MSKPTYKKGKTLPKRDRYASSGLRVGAYIIDMIIIFVITQILFISIFLFFFIMVHFIIFNSVAYIFGFLYFWLLETYANGQTLGKMICGTKTVNEETLKEVSMGNNLKNCLFKCHWFPCLIDFIIGIMYNYGEPEKKLRIMQNASQTVVIKKR